jgi:hypothetical protein
MKNFSYLPAYEDGTECSEKPVYKIQTPGNYPEESIKLYIVLIQDVPVIEDVPVEYELTVLHNVNYCVLKQVANDFPQLTDMLHA